MRSVKIALLGCGTVGGRLVRLLDAHREVLAARAGAALEITRILVRDASAPRPGVPRDLLTVDAEEALSSGADLVVELLGGVEPALTLLRRSLAAGRHAVTANKAVLAAAGDELATLAAARGVRLGFEASVCGGIPIVRVLRHALAGDRVLALRGIVNGTCNFVLGRMAAGQSQADAVAEAQRLGFAEADPSLDLDGTDAAQKLAILARLAFGDAELQWHRSEGIRSVTMADLARAARRGFVLRHVATARPGGSGEVLLDCGIEALAPHDPLAHVEGESNGVVIECAAAGPLVFTGRGAGSLPTASAVLADVVETARVVVALRRERGPRRRRGATAPAMSEIRHGA